MRFLIVLAVKMLLCTCFVLSFMHCTFNVSNFVLQMDLDNSDRSKETKTKWEKKTSACTQCVDLTWLFE